MKPKSKKDDYIVRCETHQEINYVLNFLGEKLEQQYYNYVIKEEKTFYGSDVLPNCKLYVLTFEEWLSLPDYATEEVAFKEFVLPEMWYIKVTEENKELVNKWFDNKYVTLEPNEHICGIAWELLHTPKYSKEYNPIGKICEGNYTFGQEITFDQFKEHVLGEKPEEKKERKIIGYKLVKEEYKEAVKAIINREDWFHNFEINLKEKGFNFAYVDEKDACFWMSIHSEIKKSGVLDLWFSPVYEEEKITLKSGVELSQADIEEVKQILSNLDHLEEFLKSDQIVLDLPMITYQEVHDKLEALGYSQVDLDTNGWQHDFNVIFEKGNDKVTFCGSWAWGQYALSKED